MLYTTMLMNSNEKSNLLDIQFESLVFTDKYYRFGFLVHISILTVIGNSYTNHLE